MKKESLGLLNKKIAGKIKEFREGLGWSQSDLARETKLTPSAICQIERGDRIPSLPSLIAFSKAFNVSFSEISGDLKLTSDKEEQIFFRQYGVIKKLSKSDQKLIINLANRLYNA